MRPAGILLVAVALAGVAVPVQGQRASALRAAAGNPVPAQRTLPPEAWSRLGDRVPAGAAPVASAILPGLGQALLGQHRMIVYLGAEGYFWARYTSQSRELDRQRGAYRALARNVARFSFSQHGPDGTWKYYESMGHFHESGAFSMSVAGPTVPESDTLTYNGELWVRARRIYGIDPRVPAQPGTPAYASALQFYEREAIPENLRWSWRNATLERDLYRRAIDQANQSFRGATLARSIIIANHILSAIDAFASVRLSAATSPGGASRYTVTVPLPGRR